MKSPELPVKTISAGTIGTSDGEQALRNELPVSTSLPNSDVDSYDSTDYSLRKWISKTSIKATLRKKLYESSESLKKSVSSASKTIKTKAAEIKGSATYGLFKENAALVKYSLNEVLADTKTKFVQLKDQQGRVLALKRVHKNQEEGPFPLPNKENTVVLYSSTKSPSFSEHGLSAIESDGYVIIFLEIIFVCFRFVFLDYYY